MPSTNLKNNQKVVFLSPFKGDISLLIKSIKCLLKEMNELDKWIIVLDNTKLNFSKNFIKDNRITILNYKGASGAGNARNYGLDYIIKENLNDFLLWPIDCDDELISGSRSYVIKKFNEFQYSMMSFGILKIYKKSQIKINFYGEKKYRDLLKRYSTPCGSTIIRITKNHILRSLRFGKRKRANDQLFFLKAANHYQKCFFHRKSILINFCNNKNSLSNRKWKQPFYKFLVFLDLGLNRYEILYYFYKYLTYNLNRVLRIKKINNKILNNFNEY